MTVDNISTHHDATSNDRACDSSLGSEASTTSNHVDTEETAPNSQQLDLSSMSNYLSQSRSLQSTEITPGELEIVHQQLAVQAMKRGDFKAVAQITAWMAQNQQNRTKLLPPVTKKENLLLSTIDSQTLAASVKGDGAGFPPSTATLQSARFVDTTSAVLEMNTAPSSQEERFKESRLKSKQSDALENKVGSAAQLVSSISAMESERITATRGSLDLFNETEIRKDKIIVSRPDSETPSPPSAGSAKGGGPMRETIKGSLGSLHFPNY
jgi:hypothetical protein